VAGAAGERGRRRLDVTLLVVAVLLVVVAAAVGAATGDTER
jgi:hypothetical protein